MASVIEIHPTDDRKDAEHYLIFFITGNPGLISYYETFFSTLHTLLQSSTNSSSKIFHLYGRSLAGFENDDHTSKRHSSNRRQAPYSLEEEIAITRSFLSQQRIPNGPQKDQHYTGIILIGHSVGSYILLELLRQYRSSSEHSPYLNYRNTNIVAGICLFPTVTHIAKSPSGLKFSMLCQIPNFPRIGSFLAKLLVFPFPRRLLKFLVGLVTRMPDTGAETTTQFLTSEMGIWQALHLARDEMETIKEDKWDEELWSVEDPKGDTPIPKLIFYFGQNDHWVADHTRDELIAVRGGFEGDTKSKPLMLIDQGGVPHGFYHSEVVAERVKVWIDDIVGNT